MPQDKPKIGLNLDTLEREGGTPPPFVVVVGGKPYTLVDPQEIPWDQLVGMRSNPAEFLEAAAPPDKADAFVAATKRMPAWKVTALAQAYRDHFGMPSSPEASASPIS